MNPLTKVKLINELNEKEAHLGINDSVSWHAEYKDSAWIFIGGFPYELTEGDIICVFSQYGEIANINLVRDKKTGKSKGFCFLCYEDQRSTILAVDNLNGIKIKGRTLRVDHVSNYRPPKDSDDIDDVTRRLREEGCAPRVHSSSESESEDGCVLPLKKPKKDKKEKKKKKKEKKEKRKESKEERRAAQSDSPSTPSMAVRVKKEKEDTGYEKYVLKGAQESRGQETRDSRERPEDQHGNHRRGERERDREDERRTGKSRDEARGKDEQRPRENRERDRGRESEREREKARERVKDRHRERDSEKERDRDRERHYRDREREKWRDRDSDREYRRN